MLLAWLVAESFRTQMVCNLIKFTFFSLLVSATVPLPGGRSSSQKQQAEDSSNDSIRQYESFKLSRYLRSKLMTRRPDRLAPFYRFLTVIVLLLSIANLALEVRGSEERSDELRRRLYGILTPNASAYVRKVTAPNSTAVSNVGNTPCFATRFACHSYLRNRPYSWLRGRNSGSTKTSATIHPSNSKY